MVALLRQFLVLALVSLQFAAPLVHAHVDETNLNFGIHLHEFEHLSVKSSESKLQILPDYVAGVQSAIVQLGSAIKPQHPDNNDHVACCVAAEPGPQRIFCADTLNFSPHVAAYLQTLFSQQPPSRAPPA
ncbi:MULTISPECIES: hypothetical protein [Methylomonas]|uniref:hypothetical protein n=1 Tax=Methylomonas TaxID=416 RepID=UPI001231A8C1|nr:hypothetical protein [Methylomonas rhizoryzae]